MTAKRVLKPVIALVIVILTVGVFGHYLAGHPALLHQVGHTPPLTVLGLLVLDCLSFSTLILLMFGTLELYGKRLGWTENLLLNAYSTLANFFGPGQSGPAMRGAYLKRRVELKIKEYAWASLIYYVCFAALSGLLVVAGLRPWWQTLIAAVIAVGAGFAALLVMRRRKAAFDAKQAERRRAYLIIVLGTMMQVALQVAIFTTELHSVDRHAAIHQVLVYTGVANFALFAALTPGAIGIRESFLVFSKHAHHLSNNTIVSANLIDRGAYLLFLGILLILILSLHARRKLRIKPSAKVPR